MAIAQITIIFIDKVLIQLCDTIIGIQQHQFKPTMSKTCLKYYLNQTANKNWRLASPS